jgi:hypothetical protein
VGGSRNVRGSCGCICVGFLGCGIMVYILQAVLELFRLRYIGGVLLRY